MKPILLLTFICLLLGISTIARALGTMQVTIATRQAETLFTVEIARSRAEQETGLMGRAQLAENHGMLFPQAYPKPMRMWMKNTLIPLDMLFIDARQKIIYLRKNAVPGSLEPIGPEAPVAAVLELPGGTIDKLNIAVDDTVRYRLPD